ncbi:fasciclin domain-containing protein [Wenyingzhuangia sp. IMCC45467]
MKKKIRYYLLFLPLILFTSCSKDEVNEYYARPDSLEDPIYQQLVSRGNFTNLTTLIEKAGYKDILGKSGYWTMIAPNDAAFAEFFQEQGISGVSEIDSEMASQIVKYALIYNAFRTERMSDYQSPAGWMEDMAFKRRTAYYVGYEEDKLVDGKNSVVIQSNRNNAEGSIPYVDGDNNNKHITYFMDEFMMANGLGATDYNYFYPDANYTGFNVLDAEVVKADIVAENGIIHESNKVLLPLPSIDKKLEDSPNYSLFREMLEEHLVEYPENQDATTSYFNYTGKTDPVLLKSYDPALIYSPNNENYIKSDDNDAQSDGYTLFAPNNTVLQTFIDDVLLKNYTSLSQLPKYIYEDFFNAHMVQNAVWPSLVGGYSNALEEDIRIDLNNDIDIVNGKKNVEILSNGFFYGTNKIQESNLFYSVYTSAYLDPEFTLATRLFNDGSGYKEIISNIYSNYTLFLPSDRVLGNLGFDYDINRTEWVYRDRNGNEVRGTLARNRLLRVLFNSIVPTPNDELSLSVLAGSGIIRSGDLDLAGEYIKWENNQIWTAGNDEIGNRVNLMIDSDTGLPRYEEQSNGRTYYIDNLLEPAENFPGAVLQELATQPGSEFEYFYNYLNNSSIFDNTVGSIDGVELGTSYTFIIPNNAAIEQAVRDGVLPGDSATGVPTYTAADVLEEEKIAAFLKYHIIATRTASDDGLVNGLTETLLKTELGEKTYVNISNTPGDKVAGTPGDLVFTDDGNRLASFIPAQSNNLANRTLIHLVDNYLLYTE